MISLGDKTTRPISKITRKYTFIILAVLSGIIGAIWVALDTFTGSAIVVDSEGITNEYVFAVQSMVIGIIVSILFVLVLWMPINKKPINNAVEIIRNKLNITPKSKFTSQQKKSSPPTLEKRRYSYLGQFIDPKFHGITLPTKKMLLWLSLSGLFSGINTFVYFILIKTMPITVFLPASQFVVVYLLVADLIVDKSMPCAVELQSIIMIVLGVILATLDFTSAFDTSIINGLLLIFLVLNVASAIYVVFQKKAIDTKDSNGKSMDSTNVRLWTLLFMAFFTIIFSAPFMNKEDWALFRTTFKPAFFPIAISMLLVYIARILYVRALSMGKMSIVNSLASISVIAAIPINLIGYVIWPSYFSVPTGPSAWGIWALRIIGAILVFTGIVALSISEVKIIIFAKVKGGMDWDVEKIKRISGVEKVSVLTGKHDLLIVLRSRTIGKGYQPIVHQLEKLPFLSDIQSTTILKEWNA